LPPYKNEVRAKAALASWLDMTVPGWRGFAPVLVLMRLGRLSRPPRGLLGSRQAAGIALALYLGPSCNHCTFRFGGDLLKKSANSNKN
jgi:hypothetical protein